MLISNVLHNVHMSSFQFEVPAKYQRIIIGQRGQNLKRVESKTGVFNIRIVPGPTEVQYIYTPWQLHISVIWDITINHASAHALTDGLLCNITIFIMIVHLYMPLVCLLTLYVLCTLYLSLYLWNEVVCDSLHMH